MLNTLMLFKAMDIQSRFAPLPKNLHIGFCIFATAFFILLYVKYRKINDLLWLVVCDLTVILQFFGDKYTAFAVGVCEVILLGMIFVQHRSEQKAVKSQSSKDASGESPCNQNNVDDLKDVEKAVRIERSKVIRDNSQDVIGQAFDGEDFDK